MVRDIDGEGGSFAVEGVADGVAKLLSLVLDRGELRSEPVILKHTAGLPRVGGGEHGDEKGEGLHGADGSRERVAEVLLRTEE